MKLRSSHVVVIVGVVIFGFVIFATMRAKQTEESTVVSTQEGPVPKLVVEKTNVDMGTISNSEVASTVIKIRNEGRGPLKIFSVQGSCPCITGRVDKTTVLPGGSADLIIEFDPHRDVYYFTFQKNVTLRTNDPGQDIVLIDVHGNIDPEFSLEPNIFDFGIVPKGQTVERTVLLRQLQDEPLELTGLDLGTQPVEGFEFSFEEVPEEQWAQPGKREYLIKGRLLPEAPVGRMAEYLRLKTNCPRFPKGFPIIVAAQVESFFTMVPPRVLQLGKVTAGEKLEGKVVLTAPQALSVTDIAFSDDVLSASVRQGDTPDTVYIDLQVNPAAAEGRIKGTLRFVVTSGDQKAPTSLSVFGLVSPRKGGSS